MIADTQQRIAKVRNEVKAQKVSSGLTYSQLLMPENTPQLSYTGTASWSGSPSGAIARIRFRFTRTDGLTDPPLINFTHTSSYSPTYEQFAIDNGFSITPANLAPFTNQDIEGYIAGVGDGYVDYYVDFNAGIASALFSLSSVGISVSCQVIANVYGTLDMERLI